MAVCQRKRGLFRTCCRQPQRPRRLPRTRTSWGKDAFLKLLVTQMKYQDPLNPLEGIEFTQQLAQFTSLEQLYNISEQFSAMSSGHSVPERLPSRFPWSGKRSGRWAIPCPWRDGSITQGYFTLDDAASSVVVNIYNDSRLESSVSRPGPVDNRRS